MNKTFKIIYSFLISTALLFSVVFKLNAEPSKDFIKSKDTKFYDSSENEYYIKSVGIGNNVWSNSLNGYDINDHNEETYKRIHDLGFNAVRYLFRYSWFEEKDSNGEPVIFKRFDRDIAWAKKYNIKIYFNMHYAPTNNLGFHGYSLWRVNDNKNNKDNRYKVSKMWEEIAKRYANEDTVLGWGLLNEPVQYYQEGKTLDEMLQPWVNTAKMFRDSIRKYDSNHILFVEPSLSLNKDGEYVRYIEDKYVLTRCVAQLYNQVFKDDNNYCFEYHCYNPWNFTSKGIDGNNFEPLTEDSLSSRYTYMKSVTDYIKSKNSTPFLGEFGASSQTMPSFGYEGDLTGIDFVSTTLDFCEQENLSFNYHQHRGLFGLYTKNYEMLDNIDLYNVFKNRLSTLYEEKGVESETPGNNSNIAENKFTEETNESVSSSRELPKTSGFNKSNLTEIVILTVTIILLITLLKNKDYIIKYINRRL